MKNTLKVLVIALSVIFIMTIFSGCGCEHQYEEKITKEATCAAKGEKTFTCKLCKESYKESIAENTNNHTYSSAVINEPSYTRTGLTKYTCDGCGESYEETVAKLHTDWVIDSYVDDFGDDTADKYVRGEFSGKFSNSATSGSKLNVYVYIDSSVTFRLLEYGDNRTYFSSSDTITLKTKTSTGAIKEYKLYNISGDSDVYSFDSDLLKQIKNNEKLSCIITVDSKYGSTDDKYNFEINNIGLAEVLKAAKK